MFNLKSLIHNTVSHPVAGWLWFFGLDDLGDRVHEIFAPDPVVEPITMSIVADRIVKDIGEMFKQATVTIDGRIDENFTQRLRAQAEHANRLADRLMADSPGSMFGRGERMSKAALDDMNARLPGSCIVTAADDTQGGYG